MSLIGVSAPTFWLAFIMLAIFYGWLDIAPGPGRLDPVAFPPRPVTGLLLVDTMLAGDWDTFHDAVAHLVLPSIVLAARDPRADHPHHPRGDAGGAVAGLCPRRPRQGAAPAHGRPAAMPRRTRMLPVVTLGGLAYANLLSGAVLTETVFSWPGLGRYTYQSAVALDFPAIMGITHDRGHRLRLREPRWSTCPTRCSTRGWSKR